MVCPMQISRLGIVAGGGILPLITAQEAQTAGVPFKIYTISEEIKEQNSQYKKFEGFLEHVTLTRFARLMRTFKKDGISHMVIIGKFHKEILFKDLNFDFRALWLLGKMASHNDDTIFHTVQKELQRVGVEVIPQDHFLASLLLPTGVYTRKKPSRKDRRDIEYGLYYARQIGDLEIGQTIVVKNRTVLAVEAIEGTDRAIERGGNLSHKKDAVVCKVIRPRQDTRFDLPTVGLSTVETMKNSGCRVLAIEAGKTLVVTPEEVIKKLDEYKMVLVSAHVPQQIKVL